MDTDEFIATTMRRVAAATTPPRTATLSPTPTRRRLTPLLVAAAAAVVVLLVAIAGMIGRDRSEVGPAADPTATTSPPTAAGCRVDYSPEPLPGWARMGFTPPSQPVPYVLGDGGDIAAILWATHHPLVAPPATDRNNKILWVARVGAADGPLQIRATLVGTGETVTRTVEAAPGPSIIDLPTAGCWSLDLTWGSHQDHLMLGYAAG